MRPIRLTLENLRSYRGRQEISFEDLGLFAITGSTGAGKSSLLEALVYALYGCSTWSKSNTKVLISDVPGDPTMTVSLLFEVKGQRWRVDRSCSKGNKASVHYLKREGGEASFDGETEVNRQIRELLGLDFEQFLKTVVLPQGKFAQLLDAKPADRSEVLKSLLGLNELDQMKETVTARAAEVEKVLIKGRTLRSTLPEDGDLAVAEARKVVEDATKLEQAMADQLEQCRARGTEIEAARVELTKLQAQVERARGCQQNLGGRLVELDRLESELRSLGEALQAEEKAAAAAQDEVDAARRAREESGRTRSALSDWVSLARGRDELQPRLDRLASDEKGLRAERESAVLELEELRKRSGELLARSEELKNEGLAARAAMEAARAETGEAERWLHVWRENESALDRLRGRLKAEREASDQALEALEGLEQAHARALAELNESRARREALETEQRVAALAGGCRPEDPCPVCQRALPAGWEPPRGEGLVEAIRAVKLGDSRQQAAYKAWQAEEARNAARATALAKLDKEERELVAAQAERAARGRELLGDDLDQLDEVLLTPVRDRQKAAELAREQLMERYQELKGQRDTEEKLAGEREKTVAGLDRQLAGMAQDRAELEAKRELAERELGTRTVDELEAELAVAVELDERLAACLGESSRLARARGELQARCQRELEQPRREVEKSLTDQRVLLASLGVEVNLPDSLAEAARVLEEERVGAVARWTENCEAQRARLGEMETALATQLAELGAESLRALEERARQDSILRDRAEQALASATIKREKALRLDEALVPVERLARNLDYLQGTLGNKKVKKSQPFSQWLLELRQGELLELASTRLLEMTGQQYGFSPQFTIVDRHSGQSRKPETLSGGETFMASLALALALSELVGRKGGKLEAFFLDEGFGSLSPDCLDRALDALENLAGSGRLIGVISHVGAVAERLERVLRVTRTPAGSVVQELVGDELRDYSRSQLEETARQLLEA